MANPPRHFMARTSCVIKSSPKEWDYETDTINSLNSHPQLRSIGYTQSYDNITDFDCQISLEHDMPRFPRSSGAQCIKLA